MLAAQPVITEFMADNNDALLDGDGNSPDWIEIYNAGDSPTDLAGYHLTDDDAVLEKWIFPSVNLDPGEFFVVFASAPADGVGGVLDDYVDDGGNLHANFTLDADGEYLALVEPDGITIATEFAPTFPEQFEDIAYGVEQQASSTTLFELGDTGRLLVPDAAADAAIGSTWTGAHEPFNDSNWQDVVAGVGFDEADGTTVELTNAALGKNVTQSTSGFGFDGALAVDGGRGGNSISHTDTGDLDPWMEIDLTEDLLIERIDVYTRDDCCTPGSPERDYNLVVEVRDEGGSVLFTSPTFNPWDGTGGAAIDVGNGVSFTVDLTGEAGGGVTGHKVRVSKTVFGGSNHSEWLHLAEVEVYAQTEVITTADNLALNKPTSGDVAFGRGPSNGVDGNVGSFTHSENVGPVFWQVDLEAPNDLGHIEVVNRADGCCPERLNGAVLSVLDENQETIFTADPFANAGVGETIVFDNGGAGFRGAQFIRIDHSNQYLTIAELRTFAPENYQVFIETDIEDSLKDTNSSAYIRFPFNVADASVFDQLTLGMNYDDGFVAYLNGEEIARGNAPDGTPVYNADATAENPGALFEEFAVPIPLLQTGDNVLAVHGMNLNAGDDDFLILPKLIAREVPTGDAGYLTDPTPGNPNSVSVEGFVADTSFDVDRGFYDAPFDVNITTETVGATIIYTTDGTPPSLDNGTQVAAADPNSLPVATVPITTTTTLRAAAFKDGFAPTNTDTQSYIFLSDVIQQPANPSGLPSVWDGIAQAPISADYQMDPQIVNDPAYSDEIIDGLKAIPTISIVMDPEDLFGAERGIYINSGQRGRAWEHPTSVEIIEPDGTTFQADSGIRIHGFSWRFHSNSPKHGFRLEFRDEYGPNKLEYPLFPDSPVDRFDSIVLRQQGGRAWAGSQDPNRAQYQRDTFARDLAREMGATDGHATLVHLYLNGLYWGLYNPVERPDAQMAEEYFGGSDEDYDALNRRTSTTEAIDGDLILYNEMMSLANSALSAGVTTDEDLAQFERYVAMDDFIDWFIRNQYVTNRDGLSAFDGNNQRAIGSRVGDPQFRFFVWDMEYSMWSATDNNNIGPGLNSPPLAGSQNPPSHAWTVYNALQQHPEFLLRYADRVQIHLFNDGALTPEKAAETWEVRARSIEQAIIAESARWGDARRSTPYTRDVEWQAERNRLLTQYFPQRTDILVSQYRDAGLYPEVAAPVLQINGSNQHGGSIANGDTLTMAAAAKVITNTTTLVATDSSAQAFVPSDASLEMGAGPRWYDVDFDTAGWISGTNGVGYDTDTDYDTLIGTDVLDAWNANPTSVYSRFEFTLDAEFDPEVVDGLELRMKYDDGYVVYLNGQLVHANNAPSPAVWNSTATGKRFDLLNTVPSIRRSHGSHEFT